MTLLPCLSDAESRDKSASAKRRGGKLRIFLLCGEKLILSCRKRPNSTRRCLTLCLAQLHRVRSLLPSRKIVEHRSGAVELTAGSSTDRLGTALQSYALAADKVGAARLEQDHAIARSFVAPWSATLNGQIAAAMKSRAAVKSARCVCSTDVQMRSNAGRSLHLDACRGRAKVAVSGPKAEQLRLDIEAAEEALVNSTEECVIANQLCCFCSMIPNRSINQMRAVLESPSSVVALSHFVKAQQAFHAKAAEFLRCGSHVCGKDFNHLLILSQRHRGRHRGSGHRS